MTDDLQDKPTEQATVLPKWMAIVLVAGLYFIAASSALYPVNDNDIWWHLRVGEWVIEHQDVTTNDPFSAYGQEQQWVAYSWFFEVLVFKLYQWMGLVGIMLYRVVFSVLVVVAVHVLISRREPRFFVSLALSALSAYVLIALMKERPWLFTVLFATLTLVTIVDLREGRRTFLPWCLPFLYVIWANVHVQFVYGLMLLGIACAAPIVDFIFMVPTKGHASTVGTTEWKRLVLLTFLCTLATLANPYHVRLYVVVMEYGSQTFAFDIVNELKALAFRAPLDWLVLTLAMLCAFRLGRASSLSAFDLLLLVTASFFAFRAKRDVWMIVLAAAILLPGLIPETPAFASRAPSFGWLHGAIIVGLVVAGTFIVLKARKLDNEKLTAEIAEDYPQEAVTQVNQNLSKYPGPLFNDFNWGGYLIWKLRHVPVSLDGRTNLHGKKRNLRSIATWTGGKDWDKDPDLKKAQFVIAPRNTALTALLRKDDQLEVSYQDDLAVIFVRKSTSTRK